MERIKNLINPGATKDDKVMYGSGQTDTSAQSDTMAPGSEQSSRIPSSEAKATDSFTNTVDSSKTADEPLGQGAVGSIQQGSQQTANSRMPGTFDDEVRNTPSVTPGALDAPQPDSTTIANSKNNDNLDTNKALPQEPTVENPGTLSSSGGAAPLTQSSSVANKYDPAIDPSQDGSKDVNISTTAPGISSSGSNPSSRKEESAGSNQSPEFSDFGRDTAFGASAVGAGNLGNHKYPQEQEDPSSGSGRLFPLAGNSETGQPSTIGSRSQQADENVGVAGQGVSGLGDTSKSNPTLSGSGHKEHLDQGAAAEAGVAVTGGESKLSSYGPDSWKHEHDRHGHTYEGDPCGDEAVAPAAPRFTSGPHATDTANRLDPHVGSSMEVPGHNTESSSVSHDDHFARDNTLGAGMGIASNEANRESTMSTSLDQENVATGAHSSDLATKIDPRIDSGSSKQQESSTLARTSDPVGNLTEGSTGIGPEISKSTSTAGYANPYPPSGIPGTASGAEYSNQTDKVHDNIGDTEIAGAGAVTNLGAEKGDAGYVRQENLGQGTTVPSTSDHDTGRALDRGHQNVIGSEKSGVTDTRAVADQGAHKELHGLPGSTFPGDTTGSRLDRTHGLTDPNRYQQPTENTDRHHERDNAVVGVGAEAGEVFGKKTEPDEITHAKQFEKTQKQHDKQLEKDQKAAHKEEVKEEKKHEKIMAKEERKHEKALEKEEKKHEKEGEKKHHGGILGLFHRDKSDRELREDEIHRQEQLKDPSSRTHETAAGASVTGTGAAAAALEGEKQEYATQPDRNRLHKDPPPGYVQTEYAEEPKGGYASQVTGGTGTTALAEGKSVPRGSHLTGVGNKIDPNVTGRGDFVGSDTRIDEQDRPTEPTTGLPIDISKGTGAGGTDSSAVPGFHRSKDGPDSTNLDSGNVMDGSHSQQNEGSFGHLQDHSR